MNYAYAGILYSENYLPGAIALSTSLKKVNSIFPFFLLVDETLNKKVFDTLDYANINYKKIKCLQINHRVSRWNKIINYFQFWNYTEYDKICVIDIDVIILKNIDQYFQNNKYDFETVDVYGDYYKNKLNAGLAFIKPKKQYWEYIIDKYWHLNLLEEEILYLEFKNTDNYNFLNNSIQSCQYHDARPKKYWDRYSLNQIKDIQRYVNTFIDNWWSSRDITNKKYVCRCDSWNDLSKILLLNYSLKQYNCKYSLLVLLTFSNERIQNILLKENIEYLYLPTLKENYFTLFYSLKAYNKIAYLDLNINIEENIDYLFDYPDGSTYYSKEYTTPEGEIVPNDKILIFEPIYHNEYYYNIEYDLLECPRERTPISHLWFHVKTSENHQIKHEELFAKKQNLEIIKPLLSKYNIFI